MDTPEGEIKDCYAWCWRSGEICFGLAIPEGALKIGKGKRIIDKVQVRARYAYDNKTLLVPGIPEAENDKQAFEALKKFIVFIKK